MSLDLDRVYKLLKIAEASVLHPKLASLSAIAARELEQHNADAKKENDELLAKEEKERVAAKAKADEEAKKQAEGEAKAQVAPRAIKADDPDLRRPGPALNRPVVNETGANE